MRHQLGIPIMLLDDELAASAGNTRTMTRIRLLLLASTAVADLLERNTVLPPGARPDVNF